MTDEQARNICPLFRGGSCPHSYDIYDGYTEGTSELDNEDCCNAHYHPNEEDLNEMYKKSGG